MILSMKKFAFGIKQSAIPVLVCLAPLTCHAQFLDLLKDQAVKAAQKVLEAKPAEAPKAPVEPGPAPAAESSGNSASGTAAPAALQAYQNYDFIPGDTIIFEDNFEKDEDGEFPSHWNQSDGQGAVNNFAGRKALTLTGGNLSQVSPAIKAPKYLADSWTVEYDTYVVDGVEMPRIFLQPDNKKRGPARFAWSDWVGMINLSRNNFNDIQVETHTKDHADELMVQTANPDFMQKPGFKNQWHHVALAFREGRLKIYVDQFRVYSLQDLGVRPQAIAFGAAGEKTKPASISNVRISNGAGIKIVDKKFTDAKIVTHGINFDNDRATLKPESMGTLNMIVDILKNNPEIRFDIQGHTDSSGNAAHNLALSRQRAEAVKQQLVSMAVDGARLSTNGLGDTKPIADNSSVEGRANNRRVEFVTVK